MRRFASCLLTSLLVACTGDTPAHQHRHFHAMGTRVEITLRGSPAEADEAVTALRSLAETLTTRWDAWGGGELGELNQALADRRQAPVPEALQPGLGQALALGRDSEGLFHPGIGRLTHAWGFAREPRPAAPPPDEATRQRLTAQLPDVHEIRLNNGQLQAPRAGLLIDAGGFAKGLIVGAMADQAKAMGVNHAVINAGGDLVALGNAGTRPWRIGILDPRGNGVLARVTAQDGECVFTSGDYERGFEHEGQRYHHLLDPRNGQPVRTTASATVIHHDCARADAAATALFVAGPADWPATAAGMGVATVMVVSQDGEITLSDAMADRVEFIGTPPTSERRALP